MMLMKSLGVVLFCVGNVSVSAAGIDRKEAEAAWARRIQLAERYLFTEMDRWTHGTVLVDGFQTGGAGYFPSNWMGDKGRISLDARCTEQVRAGTTCTKITFSGPFDDEAWAAVGWAYPDKNFGELPGRDITGATKLRGFIRGKGSVLLTIGTPVDRDARRWSVDPLFTGHRMELNPNWQPFELPIPHGAPLKNIVGGLTVVCHGRLNRVGCEVYLAEVAYDDANANFLRMLRSYVPVVGSEDDRSRQAAHIYDNALCILAFLAKGDPESNRRASMLADAFCWAQKHDRFYTDHRWRNAYCCGMLEDRQTQKARLPGFYNAEARPAPRFEEDWYAAGSDCGNNAWAIIALASCAAILDRGSPRSPYLASAVSAGEWIEKNCRENDKKAGYSAGFEGPEPPVTAADLARIDRLYSDVGALLPVKLRWRSTEHNLDCAVAFEKLARLTSDAKWHERSLHAREFVLNMWDEKDGHFWTGIKENGERNPIAPSDAQTWSVLALGHDAEFARKTNWNDKRQLHPCLRWLENNCRVEQFEAPGRRVSDTAEPSIWPVLGYRFSDTAEPSIWPEGSAHLAACYRMLDRSNDAGRVLWELFCLDRPTELKSGGVSGPDPWGGILAAHGGEADTGFDKRYGEGTDVVRWKYKPRQHIGATAWFLLAAYGRNPYWLEGAPNNLPRK